MNWAFVAGMGCGVVLTITILAAMAAWAWGTWERGMNDEDWNDGP